MRQFGLAMSRVLHKPYAHDEGALRLGSLCCEAYSTGLFKLSFVLTVSFRLELKA
jgi:hypothetical protein